ncbi:MBL fold metallo-hydrolase [Bacillaceae bacterium W0354]
MTQNKIHQLTVPTPYAVGDVHTYIHVGDTVTMFDAGVNTEEAWTSFVNQLKNIGLVPNDIQQVVLTHHHPDHTGLIDRLERVENVYGHELVDFWLTRDETYFKNYISFFNQLYELWNVPDDLRHIEKTVEDTFIHSAKGELTGILKEGDYIPHLPSFLVIETPGHAESHLSFLDEKTGTLIGGDFLIKQISSNPLLEPPYNKGEERPKPLLHYRQSMKKILDYPVKTIFPGHGEIFTGHEPLIYDRLEKQEKRANKVLDLLRDEPLSPFDICKWLFPKHYEKQFGLTMSETIGQLDYLVSIDEVEKVVVDSRHVLYQAKNRC